MNSDLYEKVRHIEVVVKMEFHKRMVRTQSVSSCLNCMNWQDRENMPTGCILHKALPPPAIIVYGCPDHDFDIPF